VELSPGAKPAKSPQLLEPIPSEPTPREQAQPQQVPLFGELFSEQSYEYSGRAYHNKTFRYQLFIPDMSPPPEGLPLIVWLHGYGEAGDDNRSQLRYLYELVLRPLLKHSKCPFFLLALQCPKDNPSWTTTSANADDMIDVLLATIDKTTAERPVDLQRITVAGVSSGGTGCWEFAMRHPDRFAAIALMASSGCDRSRLDKLVDVPVWAFHNTRDSGTPIDSVRATVRDLQAAGGSAFLTEYEIAGHDAWTAAFLTDDLLDWLLAQRRGKRSWLHAPGRSKWRQSQVFGALVIPPLAFVTWWSARRLQRRRSHSASSPSAR
jgi:predicted peptidase